MEFPDDKIILTHNQGIYLYGRTFAVLSLKNQTIHVFNITSDGELQFKKSIARFPNQDQDDEVIFNSAQENGGMVPDHEGSTSSLHQQLFTFLFLRSAELAKNGDSTAPSRFYKEFKIMEKFQIGKMQLLDETTLLLKYSSPEAIEGLRNRAGYHFFVFYNMELSKVVDVHDIYSEHLSSLVSGYPLLFRNTHLLEGGNFCTDASNSLPCR